MNDNNLNKNNQEISVNQEQIKVTAESIRKYKLELELLRNQAENIWSDCGKYIDQNILNSIESVKDINRKKYNNAINELDTFVKKIESVANIYNDAELEINVAAKQLENIFSDITKSISNIVSQNENNNK